MINKQNFNNLTKELSNITNFIVKLDDMLNVDTVFESPIGKSIDSIIDIITKDIQDSFKETIDATNHAKYINEVLEGTYLDLLNGDSVKFVDSQKQVINLTLDTFYDYIPTYIDELAKEYPWDKFI